MRHWQSVLKSGGHARQGTGFEAVAIRQVWILCSLVCSNGLGLSRALRYVVITSYLTYGHGLTVPAIVVGGVAMVAPSVDQVTYMMGTARQGSRMLFVVSKS